MRFLGLRNTAGIVAGRLAATASRITGRGSGGMIGGRVASTISPRLLRDITSNMKVIIVTGTNGKSTTTRMITEAIAAGGLTVATNRGGDNMRPGILAAVLENPNADVAVLEVDEMWIPQVANEVDPDVFVYLNLSRDQLDRVGEISIIEQRLRQAINDHKSATVVANIDDPLITSAAWDSENPVWVAAGQGWSGDSLTSPRTGGIIVYGDDDVHRRSDTHVPFASGHDTHVWWRAISLDADGSSDATDVHSFARPYPHWSWSAPSCDFQPGSPMDIHGPHGTTNVFVQLPGRANRSNATQALAAACAIGVKPAAAGRGIAKVSSVAGRYANVTIEGRNVRLLLAKNPAGWQESLTMLRTDASLVVGINGQVADGVDLSWLWDVEFSELHGRRVWACGQRGADLNVRLHYAGVDAEFVADPVAAILATEPGEVDVVLNYTSFRDTLVALRKRGYDL
ncbi:Mur ligase family protein [Arcanobacterium pinnipediorum]|uniref:Lipid II isoglutaminyl synthase (glutamine-hydrolyzing) subunit MurT n=1 Tax=Arcanobacterium pinnipediorum TaxID=1503041 RepID=A0ABY5AJE6_9ACTO|nr:Mur ligase family protein [Arcanobacterium pinnipediorum]USR79364.1 MurT ligase domain-containing protein [Arcanobacterium pinnipediorum]